jgi:hypothetical protein
MADISRTRPPRKSKSARQWAVAAGGNRLDRLHQLLVGDQNHIESLPADSPRRRPTMPRIRFAEEESP